MCRATPEEYTDQCERNPEAECHRNNETALAAPPDRLECRQWQRNATQDRAPGSESAAFTSRSARTSPLASVVCSECKTCSAALRSMWAKPSSLSPRYCPFCVQQRNADTNLKCRDPTAVTVVAAPNAAGLDPIGTRGGSDLAESDVSRLSVLSGCGRCLGDCAFRLCPPIDSPPTGLTSLGAVHRTKEEQDANRHKYRCVYGRPCCSISANSHHRIGHRDERQGNRKLPCMRVNATAVSKRVSVHA